MALLVDENSHIVGTGYNGVPVKSTHCADGGCPRAIENSPPGSNYSNCYATHAESNAFLHSDYSSKPKTLYVNGPPCFDCAKLIINSTVEKLVYIRDESYQDWPRVHQHLEDNGVKCLGLNARK